MAYTVNCSILLTELPLLERPAAAKAAGFDFVEFWWPFQSSVPSDADITAFERSITDAGVQLSGLNFNAGNMPEGERGLVSLPSRSKEFTDNLDVVAGIGKHLGCKAFNALYGNRTPESTPEEQDALAIENLVLAARTVAKIDGTVLLEPVSGAEHYPVRTARQALDIIGKVQAEGASNIALLADFYHLSVNGDDVAALISTHAASFGHVQIADAPGRGAPGSGSLPLGTWVDSARAGGYTGFVGLEYKAPADEAFSWLIRERRA